MVFVVRKSNSILVNSFNNGLSVWNISDWCLC